MCYLQKLTPSKAPFVSLEELRPFYVSAKDGFINFDIPEKIPGGSIFNMLDRYLKKNPLIAVRIRNNTFKSVSWNNYSDTVFLVKRIQENPIPIEIKTKNGCAVKGYEVIDQKALSDFQSGYLKITSISIAA